MNFSNETIRRTWRSVLDSLEALVGAMATYGQSFEEGVDKDNTNNTNYNTDDTEEIETDEKVEV